MDVPKKYWPFKVLPPHQRTEQHQREFAFLDAAHRAGYEVYAFGAGDSYGAAAEGREGEIIRRGKQWWEVRLYDGDVRIVAAYVGDFDCSGRAVLEWLGGKRVEEVCELIKDHLVSMSGMAHHLVVHQEK